MRVLCVVLIGCGLLLTACKSKPPVPDPTQPVIGTLSWTPGNCRDNFIVYEAKDGVFEFVFETTLTNYMFKLQPQEVKVLTVSGICRDGEHEGEWVSLEEVIAQR